MMKRFFAFMISLILILCLSFSISEGAEENVVPVASGSVEIPVFTEDNLKKFDLPDNEALAFIRTLKAGWNLGNTFDAHDGWKINNKGVQTESSWVGVRTSRELIHALKISGFNLIRIPVSWHNHIIDEDYTVDPAWLARVREVAQWAADEDMYFIVNVHHDNGVELFYPDSEHYEQSEKFLSAIWKQIAETFAEFDDHCIMESMNEPRLVDTPYEWYLNTGAPACQDAAECINRLNQKFVDLVRGTGGNNANRYLAVPGYCASPDGALSTLFRMPEDSADNRIIVSVHAYRPYDFALNMKSGDSSFNLETDTGKKSDIASFMNSLYKTYVSQGIPVLIDEYGALNKKDDDLDLQARVNLAAYYTASASTRGITCCWWDNHVFRGNGERFGIIDRNKIEWRYPDIALAILRNCTFNRE